MALKLNSVVLFLFITADKYIRIVLMPNCTIYLLTDVSYATGVSGQPVPPSDVIAVATGSYAPRSVGPVGVGGWPINVPSPVGPPGTAGWVMGLPEQARGIAQATVTGIAGPI